MTVSGIVISSSLVPKQPTNLQMDSSQIPTTRPLVLSTGVVPRAPDQKVNPDLSAVVKGVPTFNQLETP